MDDSYEDIISLDNLHESWREFVRGKKYKKDVAEFALHLSHNIFLLHEDLKNKTYLHGDYAAFSINDPKPRSIHKASVRDRLLHHAVYRIIYPYFEKKFIYDSYSCRDAKGTHRAIVRLNSFYQKVSKSRKKTCWVLKCDIRKFFATIDQNILLEILKKHISDRNTIRLIENVLRSFTSTKEGLGLPLGNLTSQLLVNVYMNEFDQFIKHELKIKYYIRYADDFVLMNTDKDQLLKLLPKIYDFLSEELELSLHPDKIFIKTMSSGIDFLGWVNFPEYRILRTVTKKRMFKKLQKDNSRQAVVQSYLGLLKHGNTWKLRNEIQSSHVTYSQNCPDG